MSDPLPLPATFFMPSTPCPGHPTCYEGVHNDQTPHGCVGTPSAKHFAVDRPQAWTLSFDVTRRLKSPYALFATHYLYIYMSVLVDQRIYSLPNWQRKLNVIKM